MKSKTIGWLRKLLGHEKDIQLLAQAQFRIIQKVDWQERWIRNLDQALSKVDQIVTKLAAGQPVTQYDAADVTDFKDKAAKLRDELSKLKATFPVTKEDWHHEGLKRNGEPGQRKPFVE